MKALRPALALCAALLIAPAARAQVPLQPAAGDASDPDGVLVEELVVTARLPGPAFWRVSDADTTVYVLGVPSVSPRGLAWDRSILERRLTGASTVILPFNEVKVGVLGAPGALISLAKLKSGSTYEAALPPALKARFVAARTSVGKADRDYKTKNGLAVGLLLVQHYRDHAGLTAADPGKTIARLAKARKLRVQQKAYPVGPIARNVIKANAAAQAACLDDALEDVEAGPANTRAAGRAWAEGDVRGALAAERGFEKCLTAAPGGLALDTQIKADQAAAIASALKTPGHAVAVVQLRTLLAQGGVLDRLRGQGFTVKTPGEE